MEVNQAENSAAPVAVRRSRKVVENVSFVTEWQKANSLGDVAKQFDMSVSSASAKANFLRKSGVPLKKFSRVAAKADYAALAALVAAPAA